MTKEQIIQEMEILRDKIASLKCKTCGPGKFYFTKMMYLQKQLIKFDENIKRCISIT